MDQLYVNVQKPSGKPSKRKGVVKENIYANEEVIHTLVPNTTGIALPGAGDERKHFCRGAAVFLGLLCLLLLSGLVVLVFLFTKGNSERKMEMALLHNSYNNVTRERNDLQISYNNVTRERNDLQISYNNLMKELDQLQTRYNNLAEEQDRLQKRFENVTKETNDLQKKLQDHKQWVYFSGSLYYISSQQKSWQQSRDDCLQRNADLLIINSKEEQDFTRRFKRLLWIGLTDREREGTWKWVDGSPLTTSYWDSGEPNGMSGVRDEDCAEIKYPEKENNWNDECCDFQRFWICEKTVAL
ncbi:CD209 antigen-like protein C [Thunnus thynnus]|uniref:CD209 antigen-like protein C n=1 Tax=Thunnus thynnus TaxID=8237 RepID=UPI0035296638